MHIVVVDPSKVVHKVITSVLAPRGHHLSAFEDAQAALDFALADLSVDVLLTSLEVTPISGLELVWRLRTLSEPSRPLYVIAMSSLATAHSLAEALDSGADDFIEKPPRPEALSARLRAAERLLEAQRKLLYLAETDPLSGLLNRRAFLSRLREKLELRPDELSVAMFDVDHFKPVNDGHGHDTGDEVLRTLASILSEAGGLACRLGGDEFALAMPGVTCEDTVERLDALREEIAGLRFPGANGLFGISCSVGVGAYARGDSVEDLLKRADLALYAAKAQGRNCVVAEAQAHRELPSHAHSRLHEREPV